MRGYVGKALDGLNITDIEKHPELADGNLCLAKPGELFIIYLPEGGKTTVDQIPDKGTYKWFNPKSGEFVSKGNIDSPQLEANSPLNGPSVLIIEKTTEA